MDQHRPGDVDLVVERERANELGRSARHAGEPVRKLGARLDLDINDQPLQHVVEQRDLLAGIAARSGHE